MQPLRHKKYRDFNMSNKMLNIINKDGKKIEDIELDNQIWSQEINKDLLHKAVVMNLANKRAGTASTKTRGEVRGGGKKPWRQKGTGRARAGSIRSPLWKGGGCVFGPHPKDFSLSLPKKMKRKAVVEALTVKINDDNLVVIEDLKIEIPKTKIIADLLKKLKLNSEKVLLVDKSLDKILKRAVRNLANAKLISSADLNAFDILNHNKILLTKEAFGEINKK